MPRILMMCIKIAQCRSRRVLIIIYAHAAHPPTDLHLERQVARAFPHSHTRINTSPRPEPAATWPAAQISRDGEKKYTLVLHRNRKQSLFKINRL